MEERDDEIALAIVENYRAIFRALQSATTASWVNIELSGAQLKALFVLSREGPAAIGQVAESLRVGLPTGSHLVERLVQAGLAERAEDPEDRRRTLARLTPKGEDLVAQLRQGSFNQLKEWIAQLDPDDATALLRGLRALARAAQIQIHDPVLNEG